MYCILDPGMDFAYGMSQDDQQSCLTVDFKPYLTLSAGIQLYKSLGIAIEFPFESTITLEYPSSSCDEYRCVNGQDQKLSLTFNELTIAVDLSLSFRRCFFSFFFIS